MAPPNNIIIKTEPSALNENDPPMVPNEIVVKPEPLSPPTVRRAAILENIVIKTEPLTSHPIEPPTEPNEAAMPHTAVRITVRRNSTLKNDSTSTKRTRVDATLLYTQLKALGDRGGFITNAEEFDCIICMATIEVGDGVRLRDCLHEFCFDCMRNAIMLSEEAEIPCPFGDGTINCDGKIMDLEIRAILTKDEYEKYLVRSLRIAEGMIQNTVHCKVPNCDGWCICDDDVNQFACPKCRTVNCVSCQAIHTDRNCKQYQDELKYAGLDGDTRRSQMYLDEIVEKNLGMKCPKCQIIIMKRDGCDWLRCSMCRTEICWITKQARWGPKGQGDTSGGCGCRINLKKCHPQCGNCH